MEAFKFAFETIVIGLLALPWLVMMLDLAKAEPLTLQSIDRLIKTIPGDSGSTLMGVALFAFSYLLGSAISPVACEFLNDEDWIGHVLPTEQQTQVRAYFARMSLQERNLFIQTNSGVDCEALAPPYRGRNWSEDECWIRLLHKFETEESSLQLKGTDKTEHINRLHERLTVLRGATFSALVLLLLIVFSLCSAYRAKLNIETNSKLFRSVPFLPSSIIVVLAVVYGIEDLIKGDIMDMPIMEAVLFFLGAFGLYLAVRPIRPRVYVNVWSCLFALFFTVLMYGGYACTEVNYDQEVHRTYAADAQPPAALTERPALQTARNSFTSEP